MIKFGPESAIDNQEDANEARQDQRLAVVEVQFANMKERVTAIVESFENGTIAESAALAALRELTGKDVDGHWLRNYWRSEDLEDFVDRLCAESIADWERITDNDAVALIAEYLQTERPGRQDRIEEALDRRYGKPTGTLSELVFQRGLSDPSDVLVELKKDTRIYL